MALVQESGVIGIKVGLLSVSIVAHYLVLESAIAKPLALLQQAISQPGMPFDVKLPKTFPCFL